MSSTRISWSKAAVASGVALAGNLLAYAIGSSANASWEVGQPQPVGLAAVAVSSIVPLLIGTAIFNRAPKLQTKLPLAGFVFALISAPGGYIASGEVATGVALASMHIITGLAWLFLSRTSTSMK